MRFSMVFVACFALNAFSTFAQEPESAYTRLDFENGCAWASASSEEEAGMGGNAVCKGYEADGKSWPVYFGEGDLRQYIAYGQAEDPEVYPGGFSQWNYVNTIIEWRLHGGRPVAAIQRWYIENLDSDGAADEKVRGQVLVISKVANDDEPAGTRRSCAVGYVDALANPDANAMARDIADRIAPDFVCGKDLPQFHGERGERSGDPNVLQDG